MEKLTDSELKDVVYFWQEKQDLERMTTFEELKPKLEEEYPEILKAWYEYKTSIKTLNAIMENIENTIEY